MSDVEKSSGVTRGHQVDVRVGAFRNKDSGDTSGFGGLVAPVVMPGASSKPFGAWFDMAADVLEKSLSKSGIKAKDAIDYYTVDRGEFTIHAKPEHLLSICQYLRDDEKLRFEMCASVSGLHFPEDTNRELVAVIHLLSMTHNRRIRVQVAVADRNPHIPSVTALWPNADWHERETYDFFGIIFDGHPALTRIQMPDDWPGHPQRKDYPLGGIPVEYKGAVVPPPSERRGY